MRRWVWCCMVVAACSGEKKKEPVAEAPGTAAAAVANTTPNQFYAKGTPTFVVGTAGDDATDAAIRAQVALARGLFDDADVVTDADAKDWPARPVIYGGPHENTRLASIELPFEMTADKLVIGGETFAGAGYRLITVLPEAAGRPELLLYAGTGPRGIAEINGVSHGGQPILVADEFGPLAAGRWVRSERGAVRAELAPKRGHRIAWRTVTKSAAGARLAIRFPAQLPAAETEAAVVESAVRGVERAVKQLDVENPVDLTIYVYPDRGSVKSLTGRESDGYAIPSSRTLHVVGAMPRELEGLMAHEATHVLAYYGWGPAGGALMGEGLAVWVSGRYAGVKLEDWRGRLAGIDGVGPFLGAGFRQIPEGRSYPVAGLFVAGLVGRFGIAGVRDHLYGAEKAAWADALARLGVDSAAMDELLVSSISR